MAKTRDTVRRLARQWAAGSGPRPARLTAQEQALVTAWRACRPEARTDLLALMRDLAGRPPRAKQ